MMAHKKKNVRLFGSECTYKGLYLWHWGKEIFFREENNNNKSTDQKRNNEFA